MTLVRYGAIEHPFGRGIELEEKEDSFSRRSQMHAIMEDFNPKDNDFWDQVHARYDKEKVKENGLKWTECLDEIRANRIVQKYDTYDPDAEEGDDPIVLMMTNWYDGIELEYTQPFGNGVEGLASYERQIAKLAKILIDRDYEKFGHNSRYANHIIEENGISKTLLHLAAEGHKQRENLVITTRKRDFTEIAKCLIDRHPGLVTVTTQPGKPRKRMPVELALENMDDEMASLLINATGNKSRIRLLFEYDELFPDDLPPFQFKKFIQRADMKKTVIAVLDSLISPDWPDLPKKQQEAYEKEWHRVPDIPVRYHFYYNIIDGDDYGRTPEHNDFNHQQLSCLQEICLSKHKDAIKHPVIRKLADTKWSQYGETRIFLYALLYLTFLVLLSVSLLGAVNSLDPTQYHSNSDKFRAFCEVLTLVLAVSYVFIEFDEMEKERKAYFSGGFNLLDLFGSISLIALVPLRFTKSNSQWYLASLSYLTNCIRIFKYFPANESLGIYAKILYQIFMKELRVFAVVYVVILFTFSGGTYLALRATTKYDPSTGFSSVEVKGFADILLRGFRAVAESNGFADGYDSFHTFVIVIILISMLVIMLFLVNILIAQMTMSYEEAKENGRLEFDISKALFVTRLENSRFRAMNMRVYNFKEGEFVNDKEEIKNLLKGWDALHPGGQEKEPIRVFK